MTVADFEASAPAEVTVITLTRGRPHLLPRAIASVAGLCCSVPVDHLIVIDDCVPTRRWLEQAELRPRVKWQFAPRSRGAVSGPGRSAILRNAAVRQLSSRWLAFLDDDNEFEPDHLESLVQCALRTGSPATHSWLQMFHLDGRPFTEPRDPWTANAAESRQIYERMVRKGVRVPGSNVFRDRCDPSGTPDPVRSIDTGEWLLERQLLLRVPFTEQYDDADWAAMTSEDDKLLAALLSAGVQIGCSGRATLRYYLGGYSNTRILL